MSLLERKTMPQFTKPYTLAIDIGGTGLKMMVIDKKAKPVNKRLKVATPRPATPTAIIRVLKTMIKKQGTFSRVSVGFPGVVSNGVVDTAPNLHPKWHGVDLQKKLHVFTKKPVKVANDADVQGFGDIKGKGVELVLTLGTGLGSALFIDGTLVPNLELGHHPFKKSHTYEDLLGKKAYDKHGHKKWKKNLIEAIKLTADIFNYEQLYLGGGNSAEINFKIPSNVHISSNLAGILGGIKLWEH